MRRYVHKVETMNIKKIFIILAISLFSSTCFANGNDLLNKCNDAIQAFDYNIVKSEHNIAACALYIEGVADTIRAFDTDQKVLKVCWPKTPLSTAQLVRIVTKYLKENPQNLHVEKSFLVMHSLSLAFPCPGT